MPITEMVAEGSRNHARNLGAAILFDCCYGCQGEDDLGREDDCGLLTRFHADSTSASGMGSASIWSVPAAAREKSVGMAAKMRSKRSRAESAAEQGEIDFAQECAGEGGDGAACAFAHFHEASFVRGLWTKTCGKRFKQKLGWAAPKIVDDEINACRHFGRVCGANCVFRIREPDDCIYVRRGECVHVAARGDGKLRPGAKMPRHLDRELPGDACCA